MVPSIGRAATALSDCAWLDGERARAYARILLALTLIGAVGWIALSPGGLDREGKPIGTDFVGFYTASRLALDGRPELAYDVGAHWAAQKALFGPKLGYTAFFYPPPALLISLPLALAPYFWSLAAWLATTGYAFYRVLRSYLPSLDPVAFLAFPARVRERRPRTERLPQRGAHRRRSLGDGQRGPRSPAFFLARWRSSRTWLWSSRLRLFSPVAGRR